MPKSAENKKEVLAPELTYEQELKYEDLSPFEITKILKRKASKAADKLSSQGEYQVLNSGRGNPNFLNTIVRKSFAKIVLFSTEIANKNAPKDDTLGFRPQKEGIANKLETYLNQDQSKDAQFLKDAIIYAENNYDLTPDDFIFELVDAALGDFYPEPPRILPNIKKVVDAYLKEVLRLNDQHSGEFDIFATEGATEAMVYSFNSLKENKIINPGDKVATVTPIFSPYLEITELEEYELVNIEIEESEEMEWQIPEQELKKLEDESIKILYLVNPTNPTSVSLKRKTIDKIASLVRTKRKDLIILTDTVYATFVDDFHSLVDVIPENTLCIYSYSKYFGVTGWRLGTIMLYEDNVIDRLINEHPPDIKEELNQRYSIISTEPEEIKFIDRLEMDSRDVALAHTGGLSCPQQCIMCLLSLFNIMDEKKVYKESIEGILDRRIKNLYSAFPDGYSYLKGANKSHYYTLINILSLAKEKYGLDFANYLENNFLSLDFIIKLAAEKAIICLPGAGFDGPKWALRVSLANLETENYLIISQAIINLLEEYHTYYQENKE
ncbi:aspartate 4-decarboxylase [Halobacteroides halobius DSM 5150]|uniref:Aminotransferase n=1 Tax=Halobacteroides halobius (strain ATCC 35273 / DSM 5150 / MD-1) TaxID=748449 RepID=L0K743_HALHC|nr:bifunctional aspartate transaminase/aspartate 4-decarboxylase [Halobacteroides halobius]AGB41107.1 aspartate 4-decarboxylase [Halobacteroides halobius DSM 5150]